MKIASKGDGGNHEAFSGDFGCEPDGAGGERPGNGGG
jgi:hypothetical protein